MKPFKNFYLHHPQTNTQTLLSPREIECFGYLLRGKSLKQIGKALQLSPRTVEAYLRSLKEKLGCHRKSDLIEKILSGTLIDRRQPESPITKAHQQLKSSLHQWALATRL